MAAPAETMSGLRKAAVLMVQLGRDHSAQVMRSLRDTEVEALTAEIARLEAVDVETSDAVLDEFAQLASARQYYTQGGMPFAEEVLIATLGADKAAEVMGRLSAAMVEMPFMFLRRVDPRLVLSFLQDEHPQTITLVLAHMAAEQAAVVLGGLPETVQADVAHRLAVMDRTSPEIVKQVEAHLERRLSAVLQSSDYSAVGGLKPLVDIINHSDRSTERLILEGLEQRDRELAEEVRAHMFMFEDILALDDRSVQLVLRQADAKELATALKGVRVEVQDKILSNMSDRAATALREEMDVLGPVRMKQVEEAQVQIVRQVRALEESGQIVISRGNSDNDFVV
jgi:flagellar motor switch protein FliG